jgi:hypothetical protein
VDPAAIIESVKAETVAAVAAPVVHETLLEAPETPAAAPETPAVVEPDAPVAQEAPLPVVEPPVLYIQNGEPAPEAALEQN